MVNGLVSIGIAPDYEDLTFLKKSIRAKSIIYKNMRQHEFMYNQVGTGGFVEVAEMGGETVVNIAAEGALFAICETDDASTQSKMATLEVEDV